MNPWNQNVLNRIILGPESDLAIPIQLPSWRMPPTSLSHSPTDLAQDTLPI